MKRPNQSISHDRHKPFIIKCLLFLAILTFVVFFNSLNNEFTNWDDDEYVTQNIYITDLSLEGIKNIFSVYVSCHYHPFTLLSLAIDYHVWDYNPKGFILTNILFHILNCLLVMLLVNKLTHRLDIAFITALLFSIHPMRVESVVWISERKDVLYVFFLLTSLLAYLRYIKIKNIANYTVVFVLFTASLLTKTSAVVLPVLMFAFDYYSKRPLKLKLFLEKIPLFTLSIIFGLVAIDAQSSAEQNTFPFFDKLFLGTYAIMFYLIKFFTPFYQSAIIPFPEKTGLMLPLKYYSAIIIWPIIICLPIFLKKHRKILIFGLLFFLVPLLPILIEFPIGPAYLAERYTYLPHIGVAFIMASFYMHYTNKQKLKHNIKNKFFIALTLFTILMSFKTIQRNKVWQNNYTLFSDVIAKNNNVPLAYVNLGNIYFERGNYHKAIKHYNNALSVNRFLKRAYLARGISYYQLNKNTRAIKDLSYVIAHDSLNTTALMYRGLCYEKINKHLKALHDFNLLLDIDTLNAFAYNNRGGIYLAMHKPAEALDNFNTAIAIDSTNITAYYNRAIIFEKFNFIEKAIEDYSKILEIDPTFYMAYNARGVLRGRYFEDLDAAYNDFQMALEMRPNMEEAINNIIFIYLLKGDSLSACVYVKKLDELGIDMSKHVMAHKCL